MFVFIVVLLLLAAAFGVLGAVLKAALILALAAFFTVVLVSAAVYYYARYHWRRFQREALTSEATRTVITVPNEAEREDPRRLPGPGGAPSS